MNPQMLDDVMHWSDSDINLDDLLHEYTVCESDSVSSNADDAEYATKSTKKVAKTQRSDVMATSTPECVKVLTTFRGHTQRQHKLSGIKATDHRVQNGKRCRPSLQTDVEVSDAGNENEIPPSAPNSQGKAQATATPTRSHVCYTCHKTSQGLIDCGLIGGTVELSYAPPVNDRLCAKTTSSDIYITMPRLVYISYTFVLKCHIGYYLMCVDI